MTGNQFNGSAAEIESNINKVSEILNTYSEDVLLIKYPSLKLIKDLITHWFPTNTPAADVITEYGTNGVWNYEKRASGFARCWLRQAIGKTTDANNQNVILLTKQMVHGSPIYSNDDTANGEDWWDKKTDLPTGLFTSISGVSHNIESNGYSHMQVHMVTNDKVSYRIFASYGCTPKNNVISIEIKGRWKEEGSE